MTRNRQQYQITVLGSGTSTGTPMVGCKCAVCQSNNPKDKRLRSSILITTPDNKNILVDTSPDLRLQLLTHNITHVDAVIITHDHADHLHGIDEIRPLCFGPPQKIIPVYASTQTANQIAKRFSYIFNPQTPILGGGIPLLQLNPITIAQDSLNRITIAAQSFDFFTLPHGRCFSTGFIHHSFAYVSDCQDISPEIIEHLNQKQLEFLLITCLQETPHDTHLNTSHCFELIKKISPKKAGLIHMNHHLGHQRLSELAPENTFPVFDGMKYRYCGP